MRWPATGLSNPPLSNSTPRRATSNPHVLTFPLDTSRTIGAPPDVNPLDVRVPSVDHKEDPGWGLSKEQPKRLARLDRPHHGGGRVEDSRRLARREASRWRRLRVETAETRGDRGANRERHPVCRDGPTVDERDVRLDRGLVQQESGLEIVRSVDDDVGVA